MVITIRNTDDFIRALRENEEFRAAARREILTPELMDLPKHFAEYTARADKQIARLGDLLEESHRRLEAVEKLAEESSQRLVAVEALAEESKQRLDSMDKRLDSMDGRMDSMDGRMDRMEGDVRVIKEDINGLGNAFREEVKAQSSFRGTYAQNAANTDIREIAWMFASGHGMKRVRTRRVSYSMLDDWLADNIEVIETLELRERAWRTFPQADIVTEVRDLKGSRDAEPVYYIVVEASYTVDKEDVLRATEHAKIVRAVTGLDAYAVVSGVSLDSEMDAETQSRLYDDVESLDKADDPDAVFWYRLYSADLRPREPR